MGRSEAQGGPVEAPGGPRFARCLGCGEPLFSDTSQREGAGSACRQRLGDDELARRRARALASDRADLWLANPS